MKSKKRTLSNTLLAAPSCTSVSLSSLIAAASLRSSLISSAFSPAFSASLSSCSSASSSVPKSWLLRGTMGRSERVGEEGQLGAEDEN